MNKALCLLVVVVCSATLLVGQTAPQDNAKEMMGTICNSACVVKQAGTSACDASCTDKTGPAVFVTDSGNVMQIENQPMAMPHMGNHVKVMASPSETEREQPLRIMQLQEQERLWTLR